jgi:hypothetical protein
MATAIEKITNVLNKLGEKALAADVANALKARKKADIKVAGVSYYTVVVDTDEGDTFRITPKSDTGFAHFVSFLKRKSSVLLPKIELAFETDNFQVFKVERLLPLNNFTDDGDAFGNWISIYAEKRKTGRATRGLAEEAAPLSVVPYVHVGNLRGMINKLVQSTKNVPHLEMDLCPENFMVRANADGTNQIVINDPFRQL